MKSFNLINRHQHEVIRRTINIPYFGIFLDMGLGKTVCALTAVSYLLFEKAIRRVLVISTKRVSENIWDEEILEWKHLRHLKCSIIAGTKSQRLQALNAPADIYTLGASNTQWLFEVLKKNPESSGFDMLILDESSLFKNSASKRFKALKKTPFKRVLLMTGTPQPNGLMDLWAQIYLLDRGKRLGTYITHFRNSFFTQGFNGFSYDLRPYADVYIYSKISDITIALSKKDFADQIPSISYNKIELKFSAKLQNRYRDFKRDRILLADEGEISALSPATILIKLLQFCNGFVYAEQGEPAEIHSLKLDALADLLESSSQNILLAWSFRRDRDRIMERFKGMARELKISKDIKDWNAGKIKLLIAHPASAGHGLNLQHGGSIVVWFGLTWNLEHYLQFNARLHRKGQCDPVIIHHLVIKDTVEVRVAAALIDKNTSQEKLKNILKLRDYAH